MKIYKETKIVILMMVAYCIVLGTISSLRHASFHTQTWDLGAFVQSFWSTTHGRIMYNTFEEAPNHLGVHMSPFLFLLVPGYFVFNSPYYLLIAQTLALALGALPLYLLAVHILESRKWAVLLAAGYLLYPSLHWVNLFDFHAVSFFIPLMLAGLYFVEKQKWWWSAIFLALAASTKENAIIAVGFVGLYALLRFWKREEGKKFFDAKKIFAISVIVVCLAYFSLSIKVVMPALGGGLFRLDRYSELGDSIPEIIKTLVTSPQIFLGKIFNQPRLAYLFWLFSPALFMPLISGRAFVLLIPGLVQNLLTNYEFQFARYYQYDSLLIPVIWFTTVLGLSAIIRKFPHRKKQLFFGLIVTISVSYVLQSPVSPITFPRHLFHTSEREAAFKQIVQLIPDKASVSAYTTLVPHLAHRGQIHMLGREPYDVDIVIADLMSDFGFPDEDSFKKYLDSYAQSDAYQTLTVEEQYVIIYRKGIELNKR